MRLSLGVRFFLFGAHLATDASMTLGGRIPTEIFPLNGGGVTTFTLRLVISPSNEPRIREYIKRMANFPGWLLLLPSGFFDALKAFIDNLLNAPAESKRLHTLRNDLFHAAYHETSKEAADHFSEMEFILGCSRELSKKHRFFVLVDDPTMTHNSIPTILYERYPRIYGGEKYDPSTVSSLIFVGGFSDLVNQFN